MKLTDEQKMEIGQRFTMLAKEVKGSLDSLMFAAPEMQAGWRQRIWADIGDCCGDIIDIVQGEADEAVEA